EIPSSFGKRSTFLRDPYFVREEVNIPKLPSHETARPRRLTIGLQPSSISFHASPATCDRTARPARRNREQPRSASNFSLVPRRTHPGQDPRGRKSRRRLDHERMGQAGYPARVSHRRTQTDGRWSPVVRG